MQTLKESIVEPKKKGIFDTSILAHRDRLAHAQPMLSPAEGITFIDVIVPVRENAKIPCRIYFPLNRKEKKAIPTLFYIPGTAFIATETEFTRVICTHIAKLGECQLIVINHRLAPENPFPTGFLDCYEAVKFFVEGTLHPYGIDKNKLALAGYSSGGNFAALMASKARKEGIPIARLVLVSPLVDLSRSLKGFDEFEEADTDISQAFVNWFVDLYVPKNIHPKDPLISPFWASQKELTDYPPTAILLAEYDRFRNDAEFYYAKLESCGINVERHLAYGEKHSYLWYKLEVTEKIVECLKGAFSDPHPASGMKLRHTLSVIKPRLISGTTSHQKKHDAENESPVFIPRQAKL